MALSMSSQLSQTVTLLDLRQVLLDEWLCSAFNIPHYQNYSLHIELYNLYKNILSNIKVSNNLVFNSEICNYNINIIDIYKELEYIIEF